MVYQEKHKASQAIMKHLPLRKDDEATNLLIIYDSQCRHEQEEEYKEIFSEIRSSLGGIILGLSNIEIHWTQLSLSDFMRSIQQIRELAHGIGDLLNEYHLPGNSQELLSPEELDVTEIVAKVVKRFAARASAKNVQLIFHPLLSTVILGEWVVIRQIVETLISNAIKFSPAGSTVNVYVSVSSFSSIPNYVSEKWELPSEMGDTIRFVRLEVHDSGSGISLHDKQHLFERYARLNTSLSDDENESGLGLYIIKKLTDATGGQIWCESNPEAGMKGSKFIVEFPLFSEIT